MRKEIVVTAKTVEQAVDIGAFELKMKREDVKFEVIELPKKGFLGLGSSEAKVKVIGETSAADTAVIFLEKIVKHMQLDAQVKVSEQHEKEIKIDITGQNLGSLIGYHGEILDSLQYLTYLAVNRGDSEDTEHDGESKETDTENDKEKEREKRRNSAVKITIDIENYRAKREETLKALAKKMAERVQKYGKSVTLEPMNAYERRIIHAAVQEIGGIATHSIGQENDRKIIISKENKDRSFNKPYGGGYSARRPNRPQN